LKKDEPPTWFLPRLGVSAECPIVVLDDDEAIHYTWDHIFAPHTGVTVLHFRSKGELECWLDEHGTKPFRGLFDYELVGARETGLDIIEELGLQGRVVLVTSRYEDVTILKRCERLGVRVVPKGLAAMLPIFREGTI
jgi:hypothetical protein